MLWQYVPPIFSRQCHQGPRQGPPAPLSPLGYIMTHWHMCHTFGVCEASPSLNMFDSTIRISHYHRLTDSTRLCQFVGFTWSKAKLLRLYNKESTSVRFNTGRPPR